MKKLLYTLLFVSSLIFFFPIISYAQNWEQIFYEYDWQIGCAVIQTEDQGYVVTGTDNDNLLSGNIIVAKVDNYGNLLWQNSINMGSVGYDLKATNDGGFIICGKGEDDNGSIKLIKINAVGDVLWAKSLIGNVGYSVDETIDGGFILTGDGGEIPIIKTDSFGNVLWYKYYDGEFGYSIMETSDFGYIIGGQSDFDAILMKTDNNGDTLWSKKYGDEDFQRFYWAHETNDGGYICCGITKPFGDGNRDGLIIKTDEYGNILWSKEYGGDGRDEIERVDETSDGGYVFIGHSDSYEDYSVWVIRTNYLGDTLWTKSYGIDGSIDYGYSINETLDGGFILTGQINGNLFLIKTNSEGNIVNNNTSTLEVPLLENKIVKSFDILGCEVKGGVNKLLIDVYGDGAAIKRVVVE